MLRQALLTLLATTVADLGAAAPLYTIQDLTPSGYTTSVAYDVNSSGDAVGVAGRFVGGSLEEAYFFYDHTTGASSVFGVGALTPRSAIIGNSGYRRAAINDSDVIAGTAMFVGGVPESRGFLKSGSTITNLGVMPAATPSGIRPASDALDVNSAGTATGTATSGAAASDNVDLYTGTASPVTDIDGDLTALTKNDYGRAINDAGLIAGRNELNKATLFSGAAETDLTAGSSIAGDSTEGMDLNESGQVVIHNGTNQRAYRYDTSTTSLFQIPSLAPAMGGNRTFGKGINESGDVVGWGDRSGGLSGQGRGFVYLDGDATTYILEDHAIYLGSDTAGLSDWERLRTAWGINDSGWIVGTGDRRFDGAAFPTNRAYLLIPFDGLEGDYNDDGLVNAADYTLARESFGMPGSVLANVVDSGPVGQEHIDTWKESYGATASGGPTIPEPGAAVLLAAALLASVRRRIG